MKNYFWLLLLFLVTCSCSSPQERLVRIQENGLYGFIDTLGHVKISPQYKYVGSFSDDDMALVISSASLNIQKDSLSIRYGYINSSNVFVVDTINELSFSLQQLSTFWGIPDGEVFEHSFNTRKLGFLDYYFKELALSHNLYPYMDKTSKKIGYKNIEGQIIIPAKFEYVRSFYKDRSIVFELNFDPTKSFADNLNGYSLIDIKGNYVKKNAWAYVTPFSNGNLTWSYEVDVDESNGAFSLVWTQIDLNGKTTIGPIYGVLGTNIYNGYSDVEGLYRYAFPEFTWGGGGCTFINKDGQFATDIDGDNQVKMIGKNKEVFDDATIYSEGLAGVKIFSNGDSRWTYMNTNFDIVTTERYDSVKPFRNNLAIVQQMNPSVKHWGRWGVINKEFEVVIPFKFSEISTFQKGGIAYAKIKGSKYDREGIINRKGEFIWETNRRK